MAKFLNTITSENSGPVSKTKVNIHDSIPSHILEDSEEFIQLLKDYYEFLEEKNMPINVITNIVKNNDIDRVDEEFIDLLLSETMGDVPINPVSNRRTFYKKIVDFYRTKGTIESFRIFFRVFFNDNIEIYYPKDNTFTLGVNRWDPTLKVPIFGNELPGVLPITTDPNSLIGYKLGGWVNKRGMLSTNEYLTDGRFYQPYSYVIKSGLNISKWEYIFNKVCHPSGFVFYGEVAIFIELLNNSNNLFRIDDNQPGFTRPSELETEIIIELLDPENSFIRDVSLFVKKYINIDVDNTAITNSKSKHFHDMYFSLTDIRQYYKYNISEIDNAENQMGTYLNQS